MNIQKNDFLEQFKGKQHCEIFASMNEVYMRSFSIWVTQTRVVVNSVSDRKIKGGTQKALRGSNHNITGSPSGPVLLYKSNWARRKKDNLPSD